MKLHPRHGVRKDARLALLGVLVGEEFAKLTPIEVVGLLAEELTAQMRRLQKEETG